jgi:DNA-binding response OmpR family regulator
VTTILVAADAKWVRDQVRAAFVAPGQEVIEVTRGQDVRGTFADEEPDLVILDMQIGNMGGVAAAIDLRLEESAGRLDRATILLLLDREADRFLAKRADADGVLVKPVDAGTLRRAAKNLLSAATPASYEPEETIDAATGFPIPEAVELVDADEVD